MLSETHVLNLNSEKFEKYFQGFDLKWRPAEKLSRFGRASGGNLFGVRKSLCKVGIKYSFESVDTVDFVILKDNSSCTYNLLPLYIRGDNWDREFNVIKEFVNITSLDNLIVVGDVNIRIGEHQQHLVQFFRELFTAGQDLRKSKDKVINKKGKDFMDFCDDYGLYVLNGTTKGDENGEFTFINSIGQSVNDICAISLDMLPYVEEFMVDAQKWSDHLPIVLSLKVCSSSTIKNRGLLPKLKWNDEKKEEYQSKLNSNISIRKQTSFELYIKDLTEIIKKSHVSGNYKKQSNSNSKWFDVECKKARAKSFRDLNSFRRTNNLDDKNRYLEINSYYRNLCKQKKKEYYELLDSKLDGTQDSKEWWSLAKEIRGLRFNSGTGVTASEFRSYFQSLLNHPQEAKNQLYVRNFIAENDLDSSITLAEVKAILSKVKLNKAAGEDRIPYEFFIHASDLFLEELTKAFDRLFAEGRVDHSFVKSVIFPIFKKGNTNEANNYRGISFMNCVSKLLIGILNNRVTLWTERYNILNEYQAGFRRRYSTMDNIYNLSSIVNLKFAENKKLYAFFIDFRAAFDKIPRKLLLYKLHAIGISTKMLNFIESMYANTQVAVWNGEELSDYFETRSGVKQGCLMSPLLFALYLNDLHDHLNGGIRINALNIKVLMYADDIVMISDEPRKLQSMINRLEEYCENWNMELNLNKSEIMIFRKGGRLARDEKWNYKGETVRIVSEYCYLGFILTPKLSFTKHVEQRNKSAKNSINAVWNSFLKNKNLSLNSKWKLFQAVSRSIQSYGAQVFGYSHFEEIDKLQRFFLKRIFNLPSFTPNYSIDLEFDLECGHIYALNLHLTYINKTLFIFNENRLPHKLSKIILQKNIFWAKKWNDLGNNHNIQWTTENLNIDIWNANSKHLINQLKINSKAIAISNARSSLTRVYKDLDYNQGKQYVNFVNNPRNIMWIFKARSDLICLNSSRFANRSNTLCTLCNLREDETIFHFVATCPILREFRIFCFDKRVLTQNEFINILDGKSDSDWKNLIEYFNCALNYRKFLIDEFN